jgi:hypothetical protein
MMNRDEACTFDDYRNCNKKRKQTTATTTTTKKTAATTTPAAATTKNNKQLTTRTTKATKTTPLGENLASGCERIEKNVVFAIAILLIHSTK